MAALIRLLRLCLVPALIVAALAAGAQIARAQTVITQGAAATEPANPAQMLLEILRDEAARTELIAELEALTAPPPEAIIPDETEPTVVSLGRRLALITQSAAEDTAEMAAELWNALRNAPETFAGLGPQEARLLLKVSADLLAVIVLTIGAFVALRRFMIPIYRRMGLRSRGGGFLRRFLIYFGSGALDALLVVIVWALGYVVVLTALGPYGEIGLRQTLYLNAFLAVELVKTGLRLLISPATSDLRPLRVTDRGARRLYHVLSWTVSLLGYGELLIVPVLSANATFAAGNSMSALIAICTLLYFAGAVLRYRAEVARWLMAQMRTPAPEAAVTTDDAEPGAELAAMGVIRPAGASTEISAPKPGGLATLAQNWHWLTLGWLAVLLVTVLTRPIPVFFDVLWASGKVAAALLVGLVLSGSLARATLRGIRLPDNIIVRLPLLERRLNRFIPHTLFVLRILITLAVILFALDTLDILKVGAWLESRAGLQLTGTILSVATILFAAFLVWIAMTSWVEYRLNPDFGKAATAREKTLLTLLRNAATIALVVITLMFCMAEIGLNIGPLLASAGVLGLAIGFGAQKMVQDIISGIFIQFENAMNVGDVVTAGTTTGVVERLTVRSVSLRDIQGVFHVIPFSSVDAVSNFTRDFSYYLVDMRLAYREDTGQAKQAMFDAFDELRNHPEQGDFILDDLEWFGLDAFNESAVILRCRIKTLPGKQWGAGRAYNEILKRIFDARGIEIPFPHQRLYFGESKDGHTQTLRIQTQPPRSAPEAD